MAYKEWEQFDGDKVVTTTPFSEEVFDHIPKGGRVLDLGCGNGRISKVIQEHGYQTYGVDVNAGAIAFAQTNSELRGVEFLVGDAKATPYEDEFFDAVIEQAVLACMEKPDRLLVLREVNRILKPGGTFSIAEFGQRKDLDERYKNDALVTGEYGTVVARENDGTSSFRSHNFKQEELEELIKHAGFELVYSAHPNFTTRSGNQHPGHQYIVRKSSPEPI